MAGALAAALIDSINDESLAGATQELIFFDQLVPAINRRLHTHRVIYSPVTSPDEVPQFFPNPRWIQGLPPNATVEDIRRAAESGEMKTFWGPISRGVEFELQPGSYFTGRERVLRELSEWFHDPADARTRVLTGGPGCGKSAILSKIVTLSEPEYTRVVRLRDKRWARAFPPKTLNLAIHAKGKTLEEITRSFAAHLGAEPECSQVLNALRASNAPFRVVLDALDEAREPTRIARDLLGPMNSIGSVKLLVGTRPEYSEKLGPDSVRIPVDQPEYCEKVDLSEYVMARLLRKGERGANTPYKGKTNVAREVAEAIANRAYPNFMIARLVSEDLLASRAAVDGRAVEESDFPETVGKAFERYLARFADEEKVRDLLAPLAWAEGLGLPWGGIWAPLASALSKRSYGDDDIRWLLDRAGSYVVEALERDRSVYRLYHQALADYLRRGRDGEQVQRLIVDTLVNTVPLFPDEGGKDWTQAHPYVRDHLAEHAAGCGMLASLVREPWYLLTADPNRLMSVLETYRGDVPADAVRVYTEVVHHVREKVIADAASYLEMVARQRGVTELADRVAQSPVARVWRVPWARWEARTTPSQTLASGVSEISALGTGSWEPGRPVALIGRKDGTVEVWDLDSGDRLAECKADGVRDTTHLAMVNTPRGRLLVASWASGLLGLFDLRAEKGVILRGLGEHATVTALCFAERDGHQVCVTAHRDLRLAIWDLRDLNLVKARSNAT
jgi:hypothetical protein